MAESLPARVVEAFMSPLGMTVLVIALFGIVGTIVWAFWEKQRAGFSQSASSSESLKPVAPPQLRTELMSPGTTSQISASGAGDSVLRNILIGVLVIGVVLVGLQYLLKGTPETKTASVEDTDAPGGDEGEQDFGTPVARQLPCDEGPVWTDRRDTSDLYVGTEREPIKSYRICAGKQAATFDVIEFADTEGMPLVQPVWKPTGVAALGTVNDDFYKKTEFLLSAKEFNMIAGPGAYLEEYDLFLAVGLAGFDVEEDVAVQRASNRGFHIARYVLDELQGDLPVTDCKSQAKVYAMSVGQYKRGGRVAAAESMGEAAARALQDSEPVGQMIRQSAPVLLGVRYDGRTLTKDRDDQALILDFLRSQGADLAGFNLRDFGPHETLFVKRACSGAGSR